MKLKEGYEAGIDTIKKFCSSASTLVSDYGEFLPTGQTREKIKEPIAELRNIMEDALNRDALNKANGLTCAGRNLIDACKEILHRVPRTVHRIVAPFVEVEPLVRAEPFVEVKRSGKRMPQSPPEEVKMPSPAERFRPGPSKPKLREQSFTDVCNHCQEEFPQGKGVMLNCNHMYWLKCLRK